MLLQLKDYSIGVVLLLAVLFAAGRNSIRELSSGAVVGNLFAALFLCGVIYNYTEVTFNNGNIVGFSLWLMATQVRISDLADTADGTLEASAEDLSFVGIENPGARQAEPAPILER